VKRGDNRGMRDAFWLSDDERQTRELARALARERIAPLAAQVDETESYPAEQLRLLGAQGLMGLYMPEAYGGAGLGALAFCLAVEEIAWACASTAVIYLVQYAAGYPLVSHGTEAQTRRYLPRPAAGEITCALSISEPGAGPDAARTTTTAMRHGVRSGHTGVPGDPVHARRHGDGRARLAPHGSPCGRARRPPRSCHVDGIVDGEVLRERRRHEGHHRRGPGLRRLRLHAQVSRRALHARR